MNPEKTTLRNEEIDAQSALELPERALTTALVVLPVINLTNITQAAEVVQVNVGTGNLVQANLASLTQSIRL